MCDGDTLHLNSLDIKLVRKNKSWKQPNLSARHTSSFVLGLKIND